MLESRKIRNDDKKIPTALLLNVILMREKLTFKKIFPYHYLKDSLGLEDKLCEIKGKLRFTKITISVFEEEQK